MSEWHQHPCLSDIAADLPRFSADIAALAHRLRLDTAGLVVDHVALRCNQAATAARWRRGLDECATLLSENMINGRTICLYTLPAPLCLGEWKIGIVELPWPGRRCYPREGWEHIEVVLSGNLQTFHARALALLNREALTAPDISVKTRSPAGAGERLPNPTLAVSDGITAIKFHPWAIDEIVASERRHR